MSKEELQLILEQIWEGIIAPAIVLVFIGAMLAFGFHLGSLMFG
jgi:hypothetical protein